MSRLFALVIIAVTLNGMLNVDGSYPERILLSDVNALTLHKERVTNARRSSPIPELKCVGGTAGCYSFVPKVVQCYNRGSDGYTIQWECKTDMDQAYRFGNLEVSCEGYDYPDDPYILKGSCGLEYTLELTGSKAGNQQYKHQSPGSQTNAGISVGILIVLVIIGYILYKACSSSGTRHSQNVDDQQQYGSFSSNPYPPPPPGFRPQQHDSFSANPPPPGFRQEYMPGSSYSTSYPGQGARASSSQSNTGGFWNGLATGGALGYLFGSRNNYGSHHNQPTNNPYGWGNTGSSYGWGNAGSSYRSANAGSERPSPSSDSDPASGSRTTSGFGGTRRR